MASKGKIREVMREFEAGELEMGKSGKPVKSRKQAVAIALSQARKAGAKIPKVKRGSSSKKAARRKAAQSSTLRTKKSIEARSKVRKKKISKGRRTKVTSK